MSDMTLDAAIILILEEHGQEVHIEDITSEINQRQLYTKENGEPVSRKQVSARIGNENYRHLFTRNKGYIGLTR